VLLQYLAKLGNTKIAFFHLNAVSVQFSQSLLDFFSLFDSRLIITLLYNCLNLVINAFSSGLLGRWARFWRKEVKSAAAVGLCCMHNARAPMCCLPERKNDICDVFDKRLSFVEIVRYSINAVH